MWIHIWMKIILIHWRWFKKFCKSSRESKNAQTAMTLGFYKFLLSEHILFATTTTKNSKLQSEFSIHGRNLLTPSSEPVGVMVFLTW